MPWTKLKKRRKTFLLWEKRKRVVKCCYVNKIHMCATTRSTSSFLFGFLIHTSSSGFCCDYRNKKSVFIPFPSVYCSLFECLRPSAIGRPALKMRMCVNKLFGAHLMSNISKSNTMENTSFELDLIIFERQRIWII